MKGKRDVRSTNERAKKRSNTKQRNDETFDTDGKATSRSISRHSAICKANEEVVHQKDI